MKTGSKSYINSECDLHGKTNEGNIHTHGWYKAKTSRRRRYICSACGKSFSSSQGSAYNRLRSSREKLNYACHMCTEGVNISAISRILGYSWNMINHWLQRARNAYHDFQSKHLKGYELHEIQADEIKAFTHANKHKVWILALIDVSTRLWPSVLTGKKALLDALPDVFSDRMVRKESNEQEEKARLYEQIGWLQVELDWL